MQNQIGRATTRRSLIVAAMLLVLQSSSAFAATISAIPSASQVNIGEQLSIELFVSLDADESASIFQGEFSVLGPGLISVDPNGYGATWVSTFPDSAIPASTSAVMSLTASSNRADHTLLGTLLVDTSAAGIVRIFLDPGTFLQRDLAIFPFFEEIPLQNVLGSQLVEITVVPEPSAVLFIGGGLLMLASRRFNTRAL